MKVWQVQEIKMKLRALINEVTKYLQLITVREEGAAVVISKKECEKLIKPRLSFYKAMQKLPYKKERFDFERIKDDNLRNVES